MEKEKVIINGEETEIYTIEDFSIFNDVLKKENNERRERSKIIIDKYQELTKDGFFVLDTETTDLQGEVVSFSLIDEKNNILINELCKPTLQKIIIFQTK